MNKMLALTALGLALVALGTACGGGDDDDAGTTSDVAAGGVSCEGLRDQPYRFLTTVTFQVQPPTSPTPPGNPPGPSPITLTQQVQGAVEDEDSYQAEMSLIGGDTTNTSSAVRDGNKAWIKTVGEWAEQTQGYELIPYRPLGLCEALAPDLDLKTATGVAEDVNTIPSMRHDVVALQTDWPDRSADFGPGSDVATLINTFDGSVWVSADGSYVSKLLLVGNGNYPDGSVFHFEISFEVSEHGIAVDVAPPI